MDMDTNRVRRAGSRNPRRLGTVIAVVGYCVLMILALSPLGTTPVAPEVASAAAPPGRGAH